MKVGNFNIENTKEGTIFTPVKNKTIKVIDLLVKIANGEEVPKKIKYHNDIHILQKSNSTKPLNCYYCKESHCHLFGTFYDYDLNDKVEIIEEDKKIEKLDLKYYHDEPATIDDMAYKINEIIEKINNKTLD